MFSFFLIQIFLIGFRCNEIEQIIVAENQPFSFDCQNDESVYFGSTLNNWSELHDGDFDLNFRYLNDENLLRVQTTNAQKKHIGFYGCRKATWTSTAMNVVYQLIFADVDVFYWNFICYGPGESCERTDDQHDENLSSFEVTEGIDVEFFCCASSNGFKNVNLRMNSVGENARPVEIERKQEFDGSSVICAQQRTKFLRRIYQNQQTLTCQLFVNNQPFSTLTSSIFLKDQRSFLPSVENRDDSMWKYQRTPEKPFFPQENIVQPQRSTKKRKNIAIIVGSTIGGCVFLAFLAGVLYFLCRPKKKPEKRTKTRIILAKSNPTPVIRPSQQRYVNEETFQDEHHYEEPVPLSETTPVFLRC